MVDNNKINADLQRKVARQKQELTRAYEQLETQRETIRNLCQIRDEAKHMWFYIQGLESNSKNLASIVFDKTERYILGETASEILFNSGFEPKKVNYKGDIWLKETNDNNY